MNYIFVAAGMKNPKKGNSNIYRKQQYLNYGLLSLACSDQAMPGSVFHGGFEEPKATLQRISSRFDLSADSILFISCPSFLSLGWAISFTEILKQSYSHVKIIAGGRWVVDGRVDYLKSAWMEVDHFVEGIAEAKIGEVVKVFTGQSYHLTGTASEIFTKYGLSYLDYAKLDQADAFVPSIEGSRGCGAGCMFCAEAKERLTKLKPPQVVISEFERYRTNSQAGVRRYYFEASNFIPNIEWLQKLADERISSLQEDVAWRTESRVDIYSDRSVEWLYKAGLRVLDLGMESASPLQLLRMGKTRNPEKYLRKCERLVRLCHDNGIDAKINVLLFPGESQSTLTETKEWLDKNYRYYKGVSVYPTLLYGLREEISRLVESYSKFGATINEELSDKLGIFYLNLSEDFDAYESLAESKLIAKSFMSMDDYYDLKSFSYYPPGYTRHDFYQDARQLNESSEIPDQKFGNLIEKKGDH